MDSIAAQVPDTYPTDAMPASSELASRWARLAAKIIDVWGVMIAGLTLVTAAGLVSTHLKGMLALALVIGWFLYFFLKDGFEGQSLGKRVMRIRVVTRDGARSVRPVAR